MVTVRSLYIISCHFLFFADNYWTLKFDADINGTETMHCNDVGDPLTFPWAPPTGQICQFSQLWFQVDKSFTYVIKKCLVHITEYNMMVGIHNILCVWCYFATTSMLTHLTKMMNMVTLPAKHNLALSLLVLAFSTENPCA